MAQFDEVLTAYQTFPAQVQSLMLSTVDGAGTPSAGYAPFVMDANRTFYLFVSGLATHTKNLHQTGKASILLIEDEAKTPQIFARRRLVYECTARVMERETVEWTAIADQFQARFGNLIQMLRQLGDFQIFQLVPHGGRFIVGFGAAYEVNPHNLQELVPVQAN